MIKIEKPEYKTEEEDFAFNDGVNATKDYFLKKKDDWKEEWANEYKKIIAKRKEKENKLKEKIKELKQESVYLHNTLSEAGECDWDNKGIIEDALNGTWEGHVIDKDCKPDIEYAKWLAKRYGYKIIKDEDGDFEVAEK